MTDQPVSWPCGQSVSTKVSSDRVWS